jgi:asparagine N-glycosylation enzyme membrane subunit Stt3
MLLSSGGVLLPVLAFTAVAGRLTGPSGTATLAVVFETVAALAVAFRLPCCLPRPRQLQQLHLLGVLAQLAILATHAQALLPTGLPHLEAIAVLLQAVGFLAVATLAPFPGNRHLPDLPLLACLPLCLWASSTIWESNPSSTTSGERADDSWRVERGSRGAGTVIGGVRHR